MKRLLIFILIGILSVQAFAQSEYEKNDKKYRFVYIAHDSETPVTRLIQRLQDYRNDAMAGYEDLIIYLSSGSNPIVIIINENQNDNQAFNEVLVTELNERVSHDVDPLVDLASILDVINKNEFLQKTVDDTPVLKYESASFDFFVNPKFWILKNNESIISPLFEILNIKNIKGGRVDFKLYESKEDRLPDGDLFGEKNIESINEFIKTNRIQY